MSYRKRQGQEKWRLGTVDELCVCGYNFGSHYNGRCPCDVCGTVHQPGECPERCKFTFEDMRCTLDHDHIGPHKF